MASRKNNLKSADVVEVEDESQPNPNDPAEQDRVKKLVKTLREDLQKAFDNLAAEKEKLSDVRDKHDEAKTAVLSASDKCNNLSVRLFQMLKFE
jgi:uncharacterized coiled-coil DUF342 family protein